MKLFLLACCAMLIINCKISAIYGQNFQNYLPPSARYSYSGEKEQPQYVAYQDEKTPSSTGNSGPSGGGSSDYRRYYDRDGLMVSNSLTGNNNMHMPGQLDEHVMPYAFSPALYGGRNYPMMAPGQYPYPYAPYMQHSESPFVPTPAAMAMLMSPNGEPVAPYLAPPPVMPYHHNLMSYSPAAALGHMQPSPFMSPSQLAMYQYMPRIGNAPYGYYGSPKIEIGQKLSNSIYANSDSLRYDLSSLKDAYSSRSQSAPTFSSYSSAVNHQYSPSSSSSSYVPNLSNSPTSSSSPVMSPGSGSNSPTSSSSYPSSLPNSYQSSDYALASNGYRQYLTQQNQGPQQMYSRISQPYLPYVSNNGASFKYPSSISSYLNEVGVGGSNGRSQVDGSYPKGGPDYLKTSSSSSSTSHSPAPLLSSPNSSSPSSSDDISKVASNSKSNSNKEELGFFKRSDTTDSNK